MHQKNLKNERKTFKTMAKSNFYEEIKNAQIEYDVQKVYDKGINLYFTGEVEHPFACDGFVNTKTAAGSLLRLIIEYKFDELLTNKVTRAKVLTQVLFYIKRFEVAGQILPNVIMVGDVNECFVIHSNEIIKYLDEDVDWNVAPSNAASLNPDLVMKISEDEAINPFIFTVDENFSFKDVADRIIDLAENVQRYVHVTEHNIATIFEYFTNRVITNKKKISANDIVAIFMGVITKSEDYYKHPNKKNTLVTPLGDIKIDGEGFDSFFSYFNRNYTPQEKMRFAEISDRLIEDTNRRNKGEFYTPTLFVDYAHDMISKEFGEDWKEKYVVWDNSAGSKNLTRDYYFNELYSSTLEQAELDISKHYNKEAVSFQFDFLNDSLDKLPKGLIEAFEQNKPIIFFMNPPYGSGCSGVGKSKESGTTSSSIINTQMKNDKIGGCSENLYAQFIYRIMMIKRKYNLTNCHIAMFTPTLYLSGTSWKNFRMEFFKDFNYIDGCTFKASHFADVADTWGIAFSLWKNGVNENCLEFNHKIIDSVDGEVTAYGLKSIYNLDLTDSASEWAKQPIKGLKTTKTVALTSGVKVATEEKNRGSIFDDSLGYFVNGGNNVIKNTQHIAMFSCNYGNGNGHGLSEDNFTRCTSLFSARRLVQNNWQNWADEYMKPNTEHEKWQEFENDSIIYSLFESKSNQSSLRNIDYKGKKWDIKNEFFFMSKEEMLGLSEEFSNDDCYNDARVSKERYVYELLNGIELSEEAQAVLDKAREIVRKTFKYRKLFNEEHENYQINNWDCGWYQIKALAKEYAKDDLEQFKTLYKKLADKMLPMVYELGFLRK